MAVLKKIGKIALIVLIVIVGVFLLVFGGVNLLKFAIYDSYYKIKTDVCDNPGLNDGFICQGICAYEAGTTDTADDKILVSGYMMDDSASRIYVTDLHSNAYYVTLKNPNGTDYTGHAGGIAVNGDTAYIANGSKIHTLALSAILSAKNGDTITIESQTKVNNSASFIYANDNYLYVGEFNDGGAYRTSHPYDSTEGKNYAIVSRYSYTDLTKPDRVYSIRNNVQGICFTADGKVVMSTSRGLSDSVYYVYDESEATDSGLTLDGAPVYFMGELKKQIKGPAMAEGIDEYNGKIITLSESASNKYIFGKFFFANKIVGLDIKQA